MQVLHPFVAPSARDPYWDLVRQRKGRLLKPPEGSLPPAESDQSITHLRRLAERLDMPHVEYRASITSGSFFGEFPFGNAILSRHQLLGVRVLTEQIGNTRRKADRVTNGDGWGGGTKGRWCGIERTCRTEDSSLPQSSCRVVLRSATWHLPNASPI
eukprot:1191869-Prorocentrum_minimum.AAC.4